MADIFSDIGTTVGKPIGNLFQGFYKGIAPGAFQQAERQAGTLKQQKDMQQLQLMISMMKDPSSNQQTKKAASDTARRILFSYHPEFENLGAGPMMQRKDWWSGLTTPQTGGVRTDAGITQAPESPFRVESIAGKPGEAEPTITLKPTGMSHTERLTTATGLRKEFQAHPVYKSFQTIERSEKSMKVAYEKSVSDKTTKSRIASDQALGVLFQKLLDPTSVVRESEYARTPEGAGVISRIRSYLPRLARGGLGISDEDRRELYEMAEALLVVSKEQMNKHIGNYTSFAQGYGVDPKLILGNLQRFNIGGKTTAPSRQPGLQQRGIKQPGVLTATNPATGKKIVSYDGGQTWQPIR